MDAALEAHLIADAGDEVVEDFIEIDRLQQVGIAAADIKKCKEAGFYTVKGLAMSTRKTLTNVKGLSENKVEKMLEGARKLDASAGWMTGGAVKAQRDKEILKISTGCQAFNDILGGGIETKAITEIYGEYRTGKSQICMTMCVTCQMAVESGGAQGKVAFIDTEGTFRPERIRAIAERFEMDADAVLDNIVVARAYTHEHQLDLLVSVAALMAEDPFKLLIVDSIMANFRNDFQGRGELADRQQRLGCLLAKIKKISEEFNVAVLLTNQVMSDPGGGAMFVSDPKKPVGGHVLAHASTTRISLRKGKAEQRVAKIVQSPNLAEAEASFAISNEGIIEYKD